MDKETMEMKEVHRALEKNKKEIKKAMKATEVA